MPNPTIGNISLPQSQKLPKSNRRTRQLRGGVGGPRTRFQRRTRQPSAEREAPARFNVSAPGWLWLAVPVIAAVALVMNEHRRAEAERGEWLRDAFRAHLPKLPTNRDTHDWSHAWEAVQAAWHGLWK